MLYNMDMKRILADRLRELRIEQGLSYMALSKLVGISHTQLCRIENGKSDISSDNLLLLCKFFHVSADYLIGLSD